MPELSEGLYRAGAGEPLLLLHGFTGTWHHWRPVLGELAARHEVIAPTLAGHAGGPPFPSGVPLTLEAAADSLEEHLEAIGVGSAHVVGNSMGGALALELAKRGRARSVIALAPGGGWTEGDGEATRLARLFTRQLRLARLASPRIEALMHGPGRRRLALRDVMRHGELVSPADAVDLVRTSLGCTVAEVVIDALRTDRGVTLRDLDRITCPVLLAWPQFDRILPADAHAPRLRREIPGVEALTLKRCGHVPMWDDTRLVTATITDFVARHAATAPVTPPSPTVAAGHPQPA